MMEIKRKMIKGKVNHLWDLTRLRALRQVELVPALPVGVRAPLVRREVVNFLEVLVLRGREILVVLVVHFVVDVTIDILGSVGRVVKDVLLVVNWAIGLCIVLRISRGPNNLLCHHQCRSSKFQDLVVMVRWVVEVLIITRVMQLHILQGSISIHRTCISKWLPSVSWRLYVVSFLFSWWVSVVSWRTIPARGGCLQQ